jgi:hypothetical protein
MQRAGLLPRSFIAFFHLHSKSVSRKGKQRRGVIMEKQLSRPENDIVRNDRQQLSRPKLSAIGRGTDPIFSGPGRFINCPK